VARATSNTIFSSLACQGHQNTGSGKIRRQIFFMTGKAICLTSHSGGLSAMVNVSKEGQVYECEICGNVVVVKEVGGGELVCCGEPMKLIEG
jgi:desulfoferrodoxin-like iron-binding protein